VSRSFDLKDPDLFTAGAVGPPGQRAFFLQAREGGLVVTLKVEKEHVRALGEYLAGALAKHPAPGEALPANPADPADAALVEPVVPAWAVRSIGVGYDDGTRRFVVVAEELVEEKEDQPEREAASARVEISRAQATRFAARAEALMKGGRPSCPICGQPKNPGGHVCPRQNGHGRP
jgi:uncharacterized repeat protein (TIGR03847 family)